MGTDEDSTFLYSVSKIFNSPSLQPMFDTTYSACLLSTFMIWTNSLLCTVNPGLSSVGRRAAEDVPCVGSAAVEAADLH